jgi:hypothetical protein
MHAKLEPTAWTGIQGERACAPETRSIGFMKQRSQLSKIGSRIQYLGLVAPPSRKMCESGSNTRLMQEKPAVCRKQTHTLDRLRNDGWRLSKQPATNPHGFPTTQSKLHDAPQIICPCCISQRSAGHVLVAGTTQRSAQLDLVEGGGQGIGCDNHAKPELNRTATKTRNTRTHGMQDTKRAERREGKFGVRND